MSDQPVAQTSAWQHTTLNTDIHAPGEIWTHNLSFCGKHDYQFFFHSRTVQHLDIIGVFYLPTDAQESCFKNNIQIYITTAPICFGLITIIRERIIPAC
jgi:hypothetical protein